MCYMSLKIEDEWICTYIICYSTSKKKIEYVKIWWRELIFEGTQLNDPKTCIPSKKWTQIYFGNMRSNNILSVHALTDGKLNFHKEYHRYVQACSTMQSKYINGKYILFKLDCVE